jgi:hypothetical protein
VGSETEVVVGNVESDGPPTGFFCAMKLCHGLTAQLADFPTSGLRRTIFFIYIFYSFCKIIRWNLSDLTTNCYGLWPTTASLMGGKASRRGPRLLRSIRRAPRR